MPSASTEHQQENQTRLYQDKNLLIIFTVSLITFLVLASIPPAFPKIIQALNVPPQKIGLLISVFSFPSLALGPVVGVFADRVGRKQILVPSLVLFGIAGTACALARDFNLLLWFLFLQGIGAASLHSLTIALISDLYSGVRRTTAIGYNTSIITASTAIYSIIGGALAVIGWYYPFLLSLAAIPVALLVWFRLKNPEPTGEKPLNVNLLNALKSFKNRQLARLFIASTAQFMLLYGALRTYLPLLIADSFKSSSWVIGLILASIPVASAITASQVGRLARRFPETTLIRASFVFYALALLGVPFASNLWFLLIPTVLFGIGFGICSPITLSLVAARSSKEYLATVISVNGTFCNVGRIIGPLLMGVVLNIGGTSGVFYAGAGIAIVTLVIFKDF
ncbi:MFS transporter [Trichocoleus sp. DQ-A3]|uniref:MFS transporter n=1 Tax=Cyanophyceae TaxID=3028117 RepID=UPI001683559A|nr:MFS transporter [Coleofasciculus sp. FACHB-125]MBD1903640.1 MFS transporter [Coleofasciculus sp. FACHB-125]